MAFHPDKCSVLFVIRNKNPIKFYNNHYGHPFVLLEDSKIKTKFKIEKPYKKRLHEGQ